LSICNIILFPNGILDRENISSLRADCICQKCLGPLEARDKGQSND
jgi:hypothetical protein